MFVSSFLDALSLSPLITLLHVCPNPARTAREKDSALATSKLVNGPQRISKHIIYVELQPVKRIDRRGRVAEIQRASEQPDEIEDHVAPQCVKGAQPVFGHIAALINLVVIQIGKHRFPFDNDAGVT